MLSLYMNPLSVRSPSLVTVFMLTSVVGWYNYIGEPVVARTPACAASSSRGGEALSASDLLFEDDIVKFRVARSMDDILRDIQWRGRLIMACEYEGKSIYAISYDLTKGHARHMERNPEAIKDGVVAIFECGKFVKFVRCPPGEMVEVDYKGAKVSRPKPIRVGDCRWLVTADRGKPVNVAVLQNEVNARPAAPSHVDPGLTIVWLALRPFLGAAFASDEDYKRNRALRDQFNAARLRLGMNVSDVEAVLRAKPLETGKVEAGSYRIYGSNEAFEILDHLHFRNILVLFRQGKVVGVDTVPAGWEWRRVLGHLFSDLPVRKGREGRR